MASYKNPFDTLLNQPTDANGFANQMLNNPINVSANQPYAQSMTGSLANFSLPKNNVGASIATNRESTKGKLDPYIQGGAKIAGVASSLANIYLGFEQLGIMKDQASMAKEQWGETLAELNHIKGVRKKITSSYMA